MEIIYQLNDIEKVAEQLLSGLNSKIVLFYGEMGVGKTTLIKTVVKLLGSKDEVSSPTFSIVNEYEANNELIFHFDLYRVKDIEEAYNFGIEDYLYSNNWVIIEWPDLIKNILPEPYDRIDLELNSDKSRTLKLNLKNEFNLKIC